MQSTVQTRHSEQLTRQMEQQQQQQQQQMTGLSHLQRQMDRQVWQQAMLRPMDTMTLLKLLNKQRRSC